MQNIYNIIDNLRLKYKSNIVFDTRLIKNDIFIGLKTKSNDGSLYYNDAIKKASLVIVNIETIHPKLYYVKILIYS